MRPARLGAEVCFIISTSLLASSVMAQQTGGTGQPALETPQQTNDRIRQLSAVARMEPHDYVIGSGDVLSIDVFDVKELSRDVRVSQTGSIGIPLVPVRLHVAGLTEVQAEQKIAEVLEANGLVMHPDVTVSVRERKSKPITVVGAVLRPLVYQADRTVTLLEVLAEAGGVATDAGDQVIVTRPLPEMTFDDASSSATPAGQTTQSARPLEPAQKSSSGTSSDPSAVPEPPELSTAKGSTDKAAGPAGLPNAETITVNLYDLMESGNTKNNIELQAGDVVTVPHSGIVYVLGAVGRPGGFVLTNDREQMTTLKILALAGGFTSTAKSNHAVVIRKDAQGKQHEVDVDLKKIRNRQAEDLQLQPSDILYVPESGAKQALLRSVEFGVALGSAVALYRVAYH